VRLQRLAETARPAIAFTLDGQPATALAGDTLLTAILANADHVRRSEFDGGNRAGFCWMGACQDCWVNVEGAGRQRACTTYLQPDMRIVRP